MRCDSCGAQLPQGQTTCEYCGTTGRGPIPASTVEQTAGSDIFDRIKNSPAWTQRNSPARLASLPQMPMAATVAPVIFFVVFIGVSGFMALMMLGASGILGFLGFRVGGALGAGASVAPAFMAIVPIGFVALGIIMIGKFRKKMTDFQNAPTLTHAAIIAGKRTQVSGGGENSSASTSYFITAEFEDGRREEFAVMTPGLFGKVSERDAGILFVRSTFALEFDRVVI